MSDFPGFPLTARNNPALGARALQVPFDFSVAASFEGDFMRELESGQIDAIQSVKIDNSLNASAFTLVVAGLGESGDKVVAAPYSIGTYPIFVPPGTLRYTAASAGGVEVVVSFFSIELPYSVNSVLSSAPSPSLVTGVPTQQNIVLTGASQVAFAANAARKRITIQNPPGNANSIWVNQGAAATADTASQEVPPGGQFDTGTGPLSLGAINIIGTAAQTVYAVEIA